MRLFHFSEDPDIEVFVPRAPVRHPGSEPLVYAIRDEYSPLYLFPRDCPRIGVCRNGRPYRLLIEASFESMWREGWIYRYEFEPGDPFVDCQDHGVFASRVTVKPLKMVALNDLPRAVAERAIQMEVVPSLSVAAHEFYDFEAKAFKCDDHVSMIRTGLLPDWPGEPGAPVVPTAG